MLNDPIIQQALAEDIGAGDISAALLPAELTVSAHIISREPMVVAGIPWVMETFRCVDPAIVCTWEVSDGDWLDRETTLCTLTGPARSLLTAERTALNFLQVLSGTATRTRTYVQAVKGTSVKLLDTRKTLPGLRSAQKYAVRCGGGHNHRLGLYDAYLIKENHIRACGSITRAIELAKAQQNNVLIEIEVETLTEYQEALKAKPHRILLDNFSLSDLTIAVNMNVDHGCELEASGGITLDNILDFAHTGVDYLSIGDLTKSVQAIDLSLLIV